MVKAFYGIGLKFIHFKYSNPSLILTARRDSIIFELLILFAMYQINMY